MRTVNLQEPLWMALDFHSHPDQLTNEARPRLEIMLAGKIPHKLASLMPHTLDTCSSLQKLPMGGVT